MPSKISKNRRWLAKSLLLGASVQAASGFIQPPHPARGLGRPAGVRPLEPSKGKHSPLQMKEEDKIEAALDTVETVPWVYSEHIWEKVLDDDIGEFQKLQQEARERTIADSLIRTAHGKKSA